ncbi:hypothetical protein ACFYP4_02690 [Streptomyces sp. NPDC005551]|uniref:hypothetical protein n=1 Tax=Streptomyces sp. NPDC005551 TaxID=3364725 RepID=UPI0036C2BE54
MSAEAKRTLRSVVQIALFAAGALPSVILASGVPQGAAGVGASLAVAAAITRVMQVPAFQPVLAWLGLDAPEDSVG